MAIFLWSNAVLFWSELSHDVMKKRKDFKKICCNRNMPTLPLSDDLWCWSTTPFSSKCSMQRIRVFLSVNEPILHRLVSHCYNSSLTFSVMLSRRKWAHLELQKVKSEKRRALLRDNLNFYTRLNYTILQSWISRYLTYLWLCPSFGFSSLL